MPTQTANRIQRSIRKQCLLGALEDGHATVEELAAETEIPKRSARKLVNDLRDEERIVEIGVTEAGAQGAPIYALRGADR